MPIRRTLKNVVRNYTDAQVKVREATSNDPWGPSSTLMSEIADLTYNVMAFTEIMQMIWKRLNDHGKNWRHVYKAMVLLDYIVKTGSEKVAQQCKENIYTIQTLKDFQYVEENKDMGLNVREKAKQLVALLKDDERLKNERAKALKAKERFAQSTVVSMYQRGATSPTSEGYSDQLASDANYMPRSDSAPTTLNPDANPEIEAVRPSTVGEEELQLQLALAMSKEEHDEDQRKRVRDDAKLQMAIEESRKEKETKERLQAQAALQSPPPPSNKETLLEILGGQGGAAAAPATDPWGAPVATNDPWNASSGAGATATAPSHSPAANDPWSGGSATQTSAAASSSASTTTSTTQPANGQAAQSSDPWAPKPAAGGATALAAANDPWGAPPAQTNGNTSTQQVGAGLDEAFDMIGSRSKSPSNTASAGGAGSGGAFDMMPMGQTLEPMSIYENAGSLASTEKTPESFLGANAGLVNLDNLVTKPTTPGAGPFQDSNPFGASGSSGSSAPVNNPFGPVSQASRVPLNQMATSNSPSNMMMASGAPPPAMGAMGAMPPPMGAMPPMSVPQPGMMGAAPPMMMGGMPPPMMMGGMPPPQTGFGGTMPMMPAGGAGVMASSPMMPMGNGSTATAGGAPASNPFL